MSRYIDTDEAVTMIALQMPFIIQGFEDNKRTAQRIIGSLPSIEIVRCGECKYNYNTAINHGKMQPRCDFADWKLTENDYCSRGEREGE